MHWIGRKGRSSFAEPVPIHGRGDLAVVLGGFGFTPRALRRHETLYADNGFDVLPVLSTIRQLITPEVARERSRPIARQMMDHDRDVVMHTISGSFWTTMFILDALEPAWRERHVRAIMFDSCPPRADTQAFGGWLSWFISTKLGMQRHQPVVQLLKPALAPLFHPVFPLMGIDQAWRDENEAFMGLQPEHASAQCVIPRSTNCLFVRGRNDPVLDAFYVDTFVDTLRARGAGAHFESRLFSKAQHALAVLEEPERYKRAAINDLLATVPEWTLPLVDEEHDEAALDAM